MLQFVYAFALLESGKYCKGLVGLLHRHCDSNSEAEGKLISWCNAPAANKGIPSNNCVHFLLLVVVEFFLLLLLFLRNEASQILMRTGFVALQIINDTSSGVQENKVWNIFFDFFVCDKMYFFNECCCIQRKSREFDYETFVDICKNQKYGPVIQALSEE